VYKTQSHFHTYRMITSLSFVFVFFLAFGGKKRQNRFADEDAHPVRSESETFTTRQQKPPAEETSAAVYLFSHRYVSVTHLSPRTPPPQRRCLLCRPYAYGSICFSTTAAKKMTLWCLMRRQQRLINVYRGIYIDIDIYIAGSRRRHSSYSAEASQPWYPSGEVLGFLVPD